MVMRSLDDRQDVSLTRRTPRFRELAVAADAILRAAGLQVPSSRVDRTLNAHVDVVAQVLGVTPRSALVHAPDSLASTVASELTVAPDAGTGHTAPHVVVA